MPHELPYTPAYGRIALLFDRIAKAKIPDALTVRVLSQSLGLASSNDRGLIPLLKKLGFIEASGKPTGEYAKLKNSTTAGSAIAEGIKRGYAPLYDANESAHELPLEDLKGLIAQVSGAEDSLIRFIVGTFNSLNKLAKFSNEKLPEAHPPADTDEIEEKQNSNDNVSQTQNQSGIRYQNHGKTAEFNPDFKFNIEIHLPSNGTEETYLAIFNALRKSLG